MGTAAWNNLHRDNLAARFRADRRVSSGLSERIRPRKLVHPYHQPCSGESRRRTEHCSRPFWRGCLCVLCEDGALSFSRFAHIGDYDAAINLKPDFASAYYLRGTVKRSLGQYKEAIEDYNTAIDLKNDFAFAYYFRGTIRGDLGEHFIAIQDYNKAIDAKPDYAFAYLRRGVANYLLDRNWAAKKDWETALELAEQAGNKRLKAQTEKFLKRVD